MSLRDDARPGDKAKQAPAKAGAAHRESRAMHRLVRLFDPGTFEEIGAAVTHRCTDYGLEKKQAPGDGVITGFGEIDGRTVCAYAQDRTVLGGSLGEAHAQKITALQDMALRIGAPIVALNDSGGARIQEGVNSLGGYGEIFRRHVAASGVIPQIALILGPCAGGAVYAPALMDFVGMVDHGAYMFLTGPRVVKTVTFEDVTPEALGGGHVHATQTGVSHFLYPDEEAAIDHVRRLLSYLPGRQGEALPDLPPSDPVDRISESLETLVPADPRQPYDVRAVVDEIFDRDSFLEVHPLWAQNVVVGFARLGGKVVGVIANQPLHLAGVLDIDSSRKAARFIRTCNAFGVPLVSLVDVPGFLPGVDQEHGAVIDHGAKLLYAYCEATVPKLSVVLRKAYGGAYIVMSSKHVGGDCNLSWPRAELAVMGAPGAVQILNRRELTAHPEPEVRQKELETEYKDMYLSPARAASRGYLDEVIDPAQTRRKLYRHLKAQATKQASLPTKRNGNVPL